MFTVFLSNQTCIRLCIVYTVSKLYFKVLYVQVHLLLARFWGAHGMDTSISHEATGEDLRIVIQLTPIGHNNMVNVVHLECIHTHSESFLHFHWSRSYYLFKRRSYSFRVCDFRHSQLLSHSILTIEALYSMHIMFFFCVWQSTLHRMFYSIMRCTQHNLPFYYNFMFALFFHHFYSFLVLCFNCVDLFDLKSLFNINVRIPLKNERNCSPKNETWLTFY